MVQSCQVDDRAVVFADVRNATFISRKLRWEKKVPPRTEVFVRVLQDKICCSGVAVLYRSVRCIVAAPSRNQGFKDLYISQTWHHIQTQTGGEMLPLWCFE
ncbi:hypothetical protein NE237_021197 [Protea cynaroides]|uniref:Uncharacterized protein n=1 Tax=Protea cynaroides TaxID=273540 RepID=A0A9Q0HBZ7_9MAGN|nr:hypothetical protein NE237_021197 [Protea cynaroides]